MLRRELDDTASVFREVTGRAMAPLWRAPFGEENEEIRSWAESAGYRHVSWTHGGGTNLDALDWVSSTDAGWAGRTGPNAAAHSATIPTAHIRSGVGARSAVK